MGTRIGGSSTTGAFRFADPDVRRHGGTRIFEKLESGVYGRSHPIHQPRESTQSQFCGRRFQDPAIAPLSPKTGLSKNLVKRNLWPFAILLPDPALKRFHFNPFLKKSP